MVKDYILVGIQFMLFIAFAIDASVLIVNMPFLLELVGLVLFAIGAATILLAVLQLNKNLSPFPTPKSNAELIQHGLYKYIRHPIYTGILLAAGGYAFYSESVFRITLTLALLVLFIVKSTYEEIRLSEKFNSYNQYKKSTGRFFPQLF